MPYKTPLSSNDSAILLTAARPLRRPARAQRLQKTRIAYALGLLLLGPVTTFGLELGEASIKSGLGQALLVEIPYRLAANETLTPMCVGLAPAADAAKALPTYARASRISVSSTHIEILGDARVLEPLIGLNVEVRCATTPRLVRSYQLFVDPPAQLPAVRFSGTELAAAAPVVANQPDVSSATASAPRAIDSTASAAPARAPRADASPRARGHAGGNLTQGQTYRVVRGDTLSGIAARVADRTTIRDAADAIFAANPDAFRRGNRDLLEEGRSITIPLMTSAPATVPAAEVPAPLAAANELELPASAPIAAVDLPPVPNSAEQAPRSVDVANVVVPAAPESPAAAVAGAEPIAAPVQTAAAPAGLAPEATSPTSTGRASTWLTIVLAFGAGILVSIPLHLVRRRKQQDAVQGDAKIPEARPRQLVDAVAGIDVVEGQLSRSLAGRMNTTAAWRAVEAERADDGPATPTGLDDLASTIGPVDSVDLDVGAPTAADEQVAATSEEDAATVRMPGVDSAAAIRQQPPEPQATVSHQTADDEQMTMTIVELDMLRQDYEAEHTMTQEANKALRDALADLKATQAARAASAEAPTMELPQQPDADATESLQTEKLRAAR